MLNKGSIARNVTMCGFVYTKATCLQMYLVLTRVALRGSSFPAALESKSPSSCSFFSSMSGASLMLP